MAPPANRRPGTSRRAQYSTFASYVAAFVGVLLGGLLLIVSTGNAGAFAFWRSAASDATAPGATVAAAGRSTGQNAWATIAGYFTFGSRVALTERELALARVKLVEAAAIADENRRLKALLALNEGEPATVANARLIGSTAASTRRFAILGAGQRNGVQVGMPVRSPLGLVGRVLEAGQRSARVLLITDGESVVPVKRATDGMPAFATGRGDGTLQIRLVTLGINPLKPGDAFVTSGSGGLYWPGVAVAVVTRVTRDGAIARPLSDPGMTEFVTVQPLWNGSLSEPAPAAAPSGTATLN